MIAALPMYDWPEVQGANDAFWQRTASHLADKGLSAPARLTRGRPTHAIWQDPDLLLAQTCGLPFVNGRCGAAEIIARPDYGVDGASGGLYSSALICRRGEGGALAGFRGARAAINEYGSQSGCNALADAAGETDFFGSVVVSGAHRQSARAVAGGDADIAAIDAVAWALFRAHEAGTAARLEVIAWTRAMPALPFITGARHAGHAALIRDALAAACPGPPGLPKAVLPATDADYAPIREMAASLSGWRLAPGSVPL